MRHWIDKQTGKKKIQLDRFEEDRGYIKVDNDGNEYYHEAGVTTLGMIRDAERDDTLVTKFDSDNKTYKLCSDSGIDCSLGAVLEYDSQRYIWTGRCQNGHDIVATKMELELRKKLK